MEGEEEEEREKGKGIALVLQLCHPQSGKVLTEEKQEQERYGIQMKMRRKGNFEWTEDRRQRDRRRREKKLPKCATLF